MSQSIFRNPSVFSNPVLTGGSVGNGTLTIDKLTHFTINQQYTAICTAISPFTVFNIIGNLDGAVGVAVVGTQFVDENLKLFLTIQQGPTLFAIGDTFEFEVAQGTDLNQQNINTYDELPQKNFGEGVLGENKGDHNIRFSPTQVAAFKNIQNLKFTAVAPGPSGNAISIEYIQGSVLTSASRTIQSLTFTAQFAGTSGNNISIEYEDYYPGVQASAIIQDISYTADDAGTAGNSISIEYTGGGTAGSEIVSIVSSTHIKVQIEDGVSTVNQIRSALAANFTAASLINGGATGTGLEVQSIQAETFLVGGINPIGAAGSEVVTVISNAIKIKMQSGVSTATQIKSAVDTYAPAFSLVSSVISGIGSTVQTAPVSPLFLQNGASDVGQPGSEIVNVIGNAIQVTFNNGLSTASQIKTAIEANISAVALVSLTLIGLGSTLQNSPIAETFLTGGRESGSYALNTAELTNPGDFFEGNAPLLLNGLNNQGNEQTLGISDKKGKLSLDDQDGLNLSGPAIANTQKTINNLIQNHKVFLLTDDNSKVSWNKPNLSFTADIILVFPETNVINRILAASSPIVINDGQHAYITVNRLVNSSQSVVVANTIPTSENVFRLFSRRGDYLIWYDNSLQSDMKAMRIGEGGSGGVAYQEKLGTGNGVTKNFPLTFIPSNEYSILTISSYIREYGVDYTYNQVGNQLEFEAGFEPALGQDIYVFYVTEGETITVPSPSGTENVIYHTVTLAEATAKEFDIGFTPAIASKTKVDIIGGTPQQFNVDFNISSNLFQWAGYVLDGDLAENDVIRLVFFS